MKPFTFEKEYRVTTPVAIIFFNRLEPLKALVARLAQVKPTKIYLIADGPRPTRPDDAAKVAACRDFMANLPWDCEIKTDFLERNVGCRERVSSGLTELFKQEEEAIILEDDCVPEVAFFPWVEKMLARYRDDKRILSISGTNLRPQLCDATKDCVFTKYAMIWGWATWSWAWELYEANLDHLSDATYLHLFRRWLGSWRAELYWRYLLTHITTSWGYRWSFTHFWMRGLCVVPPVNLVEKIDMSGVEATHTTNNAYELPQVTRDWRGEDLTQPCLVLPNAALDKWLEDNIFSKSLAARFKWLLRKIKAKAH